MHDPAQTTTTIVPGTPTATAPASPMAITTRRIVSLASCLVLALASTGCSLLVVTGPPRPLPPPSTPDIMCTSSRAAPVADTVVTVAAGIVAMGLALTAVTDNDPSTESWERGFLWVGALAAGAVAVPYYLSASRGYERTRRCREWRGERTRWLESNPAPAAESPASSVGTEATAPITP